jgi:hypothetical protein
MFTRAWWWRRAPFGEDFVTLKGNRIGLALGAVLGASLAFACGGGSDTGSDEEYVTDFCNMQREFSDSVRVAIQGTSGSADFNDIADTFDALADAFDDMKPPEDVQEWHDEASDQISSIAEQVKEDRDLGAVTSLERDPTTGVPESPRARLREIAADDPACNGLTVFQG